MSLASASIKNPVFAWMLMFGFILFGAIGFSRLPVGQYPDIDFPQVTVTATLEGAAPEIMETDVVDVLEDAVMAVEGIRDISSVCKQGTATITIEFELSRNIDVALQGVQARISQAAKQLPKDMDPPIINKTNPEENPIMWVALSGTRSQSEISSYAKNILRDKFLTVEGNGDVMMGGYLERNVRIWIDAKALEARSLSADDVINAFQKQHVEIPAGRLEGALRESNVQVEGEALNVQQMRNLPIANRNGSPIYLKDVALVEDGFEDRRRIARSNGFPAQGMGIIKQHGSNTVEVADAVRARVAQLSKTLPPGLRLDIRVDNSVFIKDAVNEIEWTLALSVGLTALVCWLFLGSLSSTLNVVLAIPVSVFGTFAVMYFAGFSMNTFTLLALSLSIGIVVDDAVMVLENIYRHAEMGKDKVSAAREGAEQISFAAFAATLAIVSIFLPVAFMTGIIGKFFFQFGVVLSVAVMISLLEALTLAPARCSQFLRVGHRTNFIERYSGIVFGALASFYEGGLRIALKSWFTKLNVVGAALTLFAASLWLVPRVPMELVPPQDQGYYMIRVNTPVGSTVDYTDKVMRGMEEILAPHQEIESNLVIAGGIGGDVNAGIAFLTLKPMQQRTVTPEQYERYKELLKPQLEKRFFGRTLPPIEKFHPTVQQSIVMLNDEVERHPFPGSRIVPIDFSAAGFASAKRGGLSIEFSIRGPDWNKLGEMAELYMDEMKNSGFFMGVDTDYKKGMPEIQVIPDRVKAQANNVDMATLAQTVGVLVGGQKIGRYKDNGRRYDVRARLLQAGRATPEDIGKVYIRAKDGKLVRLSDVAQVVTRPSLQSITRQNRSRAVTMMANAAPTHSQAEAMAFIEKLAKEKLPELYSIEFSGTSRAAVESAWNLRIAMVLGLLIAYMVLASQFNSFIHPITVLMALPFSLSGALAALCLFSQSINIYSAIGVILLMGIVKKNSILLVDYTNQVRAGGKPCDEALIEACPTRLRPILMTTFATIAGAIPAAMALRAGGEFLVPMAIAIIGGLSVSTLLTLYVVPCFYSLADGIMAAIFAGKTQQAPEPAFSHASGGK